ncbi:MAG: hypothetical protein ACJAUG_001192 [Halioglobus sp.]|jgi:hypothetical protein
MTQVAVETHTRRHGVNAAAGPNEMEFVKIAESLQFGS